MSDCIITRRNTLLEPYIPPTWADGSDEGVVKAVHLAGVNEIVLTDYWAIGDERNVNLAAMASTSGGVTVGETHEAQTVTLVIMNEGYNVTGCDNSHVHFVVGLKHSLNEKGYMNSTSSNAGGWKNCARRGWCNSIFYAAFPDSIKPIFKLFNTKTANGGGSNYSAVNTTEDRFALFSGYEVFGSGSGTGYSSGYTAGGGYALKAETDTHSRISYYTTSSNKRIKQVNGSNSYWWERSPYYNSAYNFCCVCNYGSDSDYSASVTWGLAPFGCI